MGLFNSIFVKKPKRTVFNLSRSNKMTMKFGRLYPFLCEKVVPGDTFNLSHQAFVQFAPFAQQVYQEFTLKTEYFFVPSRILWKDFEQFLVGGEDGQTDIPHPFIDYGQVVRAALRSFRVAINNGSYIMYRGLISSLFDYFNLPFYHEWLQRMIDDPNYDISDNIPSMKIDVLPMVAYYCIMYEYYMDENLQREDDLSGFGFYDILKRMLDQGDVDLTSAFVLMIDSLAEDPSLINSVRARFLREFLCVRNYPKDYFTGALPFAQKGASVNMPFEGSADVESWVPDGSADSGNVEYLSISGQPVVDGRKDVALIDGSSTVPINQRVTFKNGLTSIDDFRTAYQVQEWLEKNARGGTRYKEQIVSHFGVRSKDSRLQRPEYLLGTSDPIILGNVYTTSQNSDKTGLPGAATTTAAGTSVSRTARYSATEHGYIMAIVSIYPKASYFKGIPRQWMELDKFDYYWPEFQHLGEQEVKQGELFVNHGMREGKDDVFNSTFGYVPRYSQYKTRLNEIHGDFRDTLLNMTSARDIRGTGDYHVRLNSDFIQIDPSLNGLDRPFVRTVDDTDKVFCDIYVTCKAIRPMSYYGTPRLVL